MFVKLVELENTPQPILVTLSGIVIFFNVEQLSNAQSPKLFTPFGISYAILLLPIGYCISLVLFLSNNTPS